MQKVLSEWKGGIANDATTYDEFGGPVNVYVFPVPVGP
jgi:hypothetical protein